MHFALVQKTEQHQRSGDRAQRHQVGDAAVRLLAVTQLSNFGGLDADGAAPAKYQSDGVGSYCQDRVPVKRVDLGLHRPAAVTELVPGVAGAQQSARTGEGDPGDHAARVHPAASV
jgi:hypothetical protein